MERSTKRMPVLFVSLFLLMAGLFAFVLAPAAHADQTASNLPPDRMAGQDIDTAYWDVSDNSANDKGTVYTLTSAQSGKELSDTNLTKTKNWRLENDETILDTMHISGKVTIDLNGHKLVKSSAWGPVLRVEKKGKLIVKDSKGGGSITGKNLNGDLKRSSGGGVVVANRGEFFLHGGSIKDCEARNGGGVYVDGGYFKMTSGEISNCTANDGGGIYLTNRGKLYKMGGDVTDCHANNDGGGIFVDNSNIGLCGGKIINGQAGHNGGGVYLKSGYVEHNGHSINGCTASESGGAMYLEGGKLATYGGGHIDRDTTSHAKTGKALYLENGSTLLAAGGYVDGDVYNSGTITRHKGQAYCTFNGKVKTADNGKIDNNAMRTINFNTAGGTKVEKQMALQGQKIEQPISTRSGYALEGWYWGDKKWNFRTDVVEKGGTLKAKWSQVPGEFVMDVLEAATSGNAEALNQALLNLGTMSSGGNANPAA